MSTLGKTIQVKGELRAFEDITIEGLVEGPLFCESFAVVLGPSADVRGDVLARDITVFGRVTGQLIATDVVDVRPDANVTGQVMSKRFILDPAAYFAGRVGPGWDQLGARTSDRDLSLVLKGLAKRPIDYFKMFYADTALFGAFDATVCGLNFYGAPNVLFASDAPFDPEKGPMYIRETIAIVERLPISGAEREQIFWKNAVTLLKLDT